MSFHVNCFSVAVWRRSSPKSSKFAGPEPFSMHISLGFGCGCGWVTELEWQAAELAGRAHYIHVRPHFRTHPTDVLRTPFADPSPDGALFPFAISPHGRQHFFQFASATMGYQMTTCKVLGIATSCGSKDGAASSSSLFNSDWSLFQIDFYYFAFIFYSHSFPCPSSRPRPDFCRAEPGALWISAWHCGPIKVTVARHRGGR